MQLWVREYKGALKRACFTIFDNFFLGLNPLPNNHFTINFVETLIRPNQKYVIFWQLVLYLDIDSNGGKISLLPLPSVG